VLPEGSQQWQGSEEEAVDPGTELRLAVHRVMVAEASVAAALLVLGAAATAWRWQYVVLSIRSGGLSAPDACWLRFAVALGGVVAASLAWCSAGSQPPTRPSVVMLLYAMVVVLCVNVWASASLTYLCGFLHSVPSAEGGTYAILIVVLGCFLLLVDNLVLLALMVGVYRLLELTDATRPGQRLNRRHARRLAGAVALGTAVAADLDPDYWSGDEKRAAERDELDSGGESTEV
jgi:hypothetical protein